MYIVTRITRISGRIRVLEKLAASQGFALLCSAFFEIVRICASLGKSVLVFTNLDEFAQIFVSLHKSALVCAYLMWPDPPY